MMSTVKVISKNLDRGRKDKAKPRPVVKYVTEESVRAVAGLVGVRGEPAKAEVGQLRERHIDRRQEHQDDQDRNTRRSLSQAPYT